MVNISLSSVLMVALEADVASTFVLMLDAVFESFVVADSVDTLTDFGEVLFTSENKTTTECLVLNQNEVRLVRETNI